MNANWGNALCYCCRLCTPAALAICACLGVRAGADTIYTATSNGSAGVIFATDVATGVTSTLITGTGPAGNQISTPTALAISADGDVYVGNGSDQGYIVEVTPKGVPSTFAPEASLVAGLAFDNGGNLYVSEYVSQSIGKFSPTGTYSPFASGVQHPQLESFDPAGNLYVMSNETQNGSTAVKIASDGTSSVLGTGIAGLYWDSKGDLYTGTGAGNITLTAPSGNTSTIATGFSYPVPLGVDSRGDLYVWDAGSNGVVDSVSPAGAVTPLLSVPDAYDVVVAVPEPCSLWALLATACFRRRHGAPLPAVVRGWLVRFAKAGARAQAL